jgi:uncharacterized protein (DUF2147 family)
MIPAMNIPYRWLGIWLLAAFLSCTAPALLAAPPELAGLWKQVDEDSGEPSALIRITQRADGRYEAVVEHYFPGPGESPNPVCERCSGELHDRPVVGMKILNGLRRKSDGNYSGGEILDPESGRTYRCSMTLSPDGRTVKVTGYLGLALFGRVEQWTRME